jgi:acyl carrier protein
MSRWLLTQRVQHLKLLSRSGHFTPDSQAALLQAGFNATITLTKCDAGFAEDAKAALVGNIGPHATGLLHAGGVLADATVGNQTAAGTRAVFSPKATALQHLEAGLGMQPMQHSVLFSSLAALLGSVGQLNYSMANSWLDSAAALKRTEGAEVLSVQFGAWKGGGMAAASSIKMESMGLGALTPVTGLNSLIGLLRAVATGLAAVALRPAVAMSPINWPAFLKGIPTVPPFLHSFQHLQMPAASEKQAAVSGPASVPAAASSGPTAGMSAEERLHYLSSVVAAAAVSIIGGSVSADEPLMAAGLDSLGAVELRNSLESRLGVQLPSTLVFDYPTVTAISGFVDGLTAIPTARAVSDSAAVTTPANLRAWPVAPESLSSTALVAITGMASRSPDAGLTAEIMRDAIGSIPVSRWDAELKLTQDLPARFGGFISGETVVYVVGRGRCSASPTSLLFIIIRDGA